MQDRTWSIPGLKTITVTAANELGSAVGTHAILIAKVFVAGPTGRTLIFTDTNGPNIYLNYLAAPVCHLSEFAMLGESSGSTIYLPLVLRNR